MIWRDYGSAGGIDDLLGRAKGVNDDNSGAMGDPIVQYAFNGAGRMVTKDYPTPDVSLTYHNGTPQSGVYDGFDRFGRVVRQQWYDYNGSSTVWQGEPRL